MIGVVANPSEWPVISEFFELFKTPWEFYRAGRPYEVVLCAGDIQFDENVARLVVTYAGRPLSTDCQANVLECPRGKGPRLLSYKGSHIPIYGDCVTFPQETAEVLVDKETAQPAMHVDNLRGNMRSRIGYDLFGEIRTLLTLGQPRDHAAIPTLELHIALVRELIIASGASFVEVPPVPDGYPFIACLTHDVDHPSIRQHRFDHTMFGFLYRSIFGSLLDVVRGRTSVPELLRNWTAALKLPLVHLGLAKDFWNRFQDYPKIEQGAPSTFFVIPFKGRSGTSERGPAPSRRAANYGAADIGVQMQNLLAAGCEIGLHGIDAWRDSISGRRELEEIRSITGTRELGVRMHWLYFSEQSPLNLERAGATYDSTVGYNDAIGYRAGTTQVYKPPPATHLLELPLHLMDTALFYPRRMNLSPAAARRQVADLINQACQFGGTITINWHDRSIAPERNWGKFYKEMIYQLNQRKAWFATASQAVAWFRKRRSITFDSLRWESGTLRLKITVHRAADSPPLCLRIYKPQSKSDTPGRCAVRRADINLSFSKGLDIKIDLALLSKATPPQAASTNDSVTYAV